MEQQTKVLGKEKDLRRERSSAREVGKRPKIRVFSLVIGRRKLMCLILMWTTSEVRFPNGLKETVVTVESLRTTCDGKQISKDDRKM